MTIDKLSIWNKALARIGAGAVFAEDEETDLAEQVAAIYDDMIDAALELWSWSWPARTLQLDKRSAVPFGYSASFAFPALAIGPPLALYTSTDARATPLRAFAVEGRTVSADAETLWGKFICRVDPADWPPSFRLAFTVWLASGLAVPVTQDANLKAQLEQEALGTPSEGGRGGLFGRAIAVDVARSGGVAPLGATDPLTGVGYAPTDERFQW